jgi:hypothetical protein
MDDETTFAGELAVLLNKYSKEQGSNTPDYILADFVRQSLGAFDAGVRARETWHGARVLLNGRRVPISGNTEGLWTDTEGSVAALNEAAEPPVDLFRAMVRGLLDEGILDAAELREIVDDVAREEER